MLKAAIITIGDEILIGQVVDTNSSHLSRALGALGIRTERMISIGDDAQTIYETLDSAIREYDIVLTTGGLGPTKDDITKEVLRRLSGSEGYKEDKGQLAMVYEILHARGLDVLEINKAQALVPDRCEVIVNKRGTAPIMVFRFGNENGASPQGKGRATLYALPGVPHEALAALEDIQNNIRAHYPLDHIQHRTVMTFGIAESALAQRIADWEDALPENVHLAYLPNPLTGVRLRLSAYGCDDAQLLENCLKGLRPLIDEYLYAEEDTDLPTVIGTLLKQKGLTMSAAESCTGGTISQLMTSVPGCSEYYLGSVTSYANSVKENVLHVPADIIEQYGAVSSECVAQMAEGVRQLTGSDVSVATSGIAGPGGGTPDKPVGLVWIGISTPLGTKTFRHIFKNDRARNIERFASTALNHLRQEILAL